MRIKRRSVKDNGGCDFCNRGEILAIEGGVTVSHPYKHVTAVGIEGHGVLVQFCDDCLQELANHLEKEQ